MSYRILIIDDEQQISVAVKLRLEAQQYEVHLATSGEEGLERVKAIQPDLILLDVSMPPGMDGYEVCRTIRSTPGIDHTQIIMLTIHNSREDILTALAAGANDFIEKPSTMAGIEATVKRRLAQVDALRQAGQPALAPANAVGNRVFISYSRSDGKFVEWLAQRLAQEGFEVWYDREILSGRDWLLEIGTELRKADQMVVVVTPKAMASRHVTDEWSTFYKSHRTIHPAILIPCDLPFPLSGINWCDFSSSRADGLDCLIRGLT
jgi:two-component system, OmpR family, phosphate regulon response regulator PhoB